ncbi:YaaA family protein [Microbacterium sp. CIAB417]|uniref:YaaA family protein n=1 Tax=Microbacterium sp. CIAB417 TaxID=2860287 RepID=UPI001FAB400C|nr:peroxide stress protein YaaA [Microbacterium sp. CIAB417]
MKILLPPSETKRAGGASGAFDARRLALPALGPQREAVIDALVDLSADEDAARRVLKLSDRQVGEIEHNRLLRTSPTMPAVDRYTGVLFDELDAATLGAEVRAHLHEHVLIHSAPFGPVAALDPIPVYRLAAGASLPGVAPLRRHWSEATTRALAEDDAPFLLDLRSEAYAALGPVPASVPSAYVRVVADEGGVTRALNHFNKKAKGAFVRAFAEDLVSVQTPADLLAWAAARDIVLRTTSDPGIWELVAPA